MRLWNCKCDCKNCKSVYKNCKSVCKNSKCDCKTVNVTVKLRRGDKLWPKFRNRFCSDENDNLGINLAKKLLARKSCTGKTDLLKICLFWASVGRWTALGFLVCQNTTRQPCCKQSRFTYTKNFDTWLLIFLYICNNTAKYRPIIWAHLFSKKINLKKLYILSNLCRESIRVKYFLSETPLCGFLVRKRALCFTKCLVLLLIMFTLHNN
jgi:hypothetical protein